MSALCYRRYPFPQGALPSLGICGLFFAPLSVSLLKSSFSSFFLFFEGNTAKFPIGFLFICFFQNGEGKEKKKRNNAI